MKQVTKVESDKWQRWTDVLQYGTLGGLLGTIIILEFLPIEESKKIVWYFAGALLIMGTIAFIVSRKALKIKMQYLDQEFNRWKL